jgi:hypothetical protein
VAGGAAQHREVAELPYFAEMVEKFAPTFVSQQTIFISTVNVSELTRCRLSRILRIALIIISIVHITALMSLWLLGQLEPRSGS